MAPSIPSRPPGRSRRWAAAFSLALCVLTATAGVAQEAPSPSGAAAAQAGEDTPYRKALGEFSQAFEQRRFTEAGQALAELEKLRPGAPEVQGCRAAFLAETGKTGKAREIYQKMLEASPGNFVYQFNLAELFCLERKYPEAKAAFEAMLAKFPDSDFVKLKLVLIGVALNDRASAIEWAGKIHPAPSAIGFYAQAALALSSGEMAKGRALIRAADEQFGAGQWRLLHDNLAEIGLVLRGDYPPGRGN